MQIKYPEMLFLLLLIPVFIWYYKAKKQNASVMFSSTAHLGKLHKSALLYFNYIPFFLWVMAFILMILAASRIQKGTDYSTTHTEGVDIVLAVDVSTSMLAEDFIVNNRRHNRLVAVKKVVQEFIEKRTHDRISLIVFAGQAYTQCPLTLDYDILLDFLSKTEIAMIEDGTGIGLAVSASVNRLKNTKAKSKVVILLTDGRNNKGKISPETAAAAAKALGIKIYTIGAGSHGKAPIPVPDRFGNVRYQYMKADIDEDLLKAIAKNTGGQYFRATDTASLSNIYKQIDAMEKTKTEVNVYSNYKELFPYFLMPAIFLLLIEMILTSTVFRKLP